MRSRHLSYSEVGRIGVQVAEALVRGHASGAPHGAITPDAILLDDDGRARLVAPPNRRTPDAYLAPEQVRGEPIGPQTDVYALGLVLLEAATGEQAYPGAGPEAARARLYQPPEVPNDVPPQLARALLAMTETSPEARPSAERTVDLLSSRAPAPPAGPESTPATAGALGGWSAGRIAAVALPVLALLIVLGVVLFANSGDDDSSGKQAAGSSSTASATSTPDDSDSASASENPSDSDSPSESNSAGDDTSSARPTGSSKPSHSKIALPTELPDMPKFSTPKLPTSEDVSSSVSDKVQKAWDDFTDWLGSFVK